MADKLKKREEVDIKETWALSDIFESDEAWEKEFERISSEVPMYSDFEGKLGQSAKILYDCLVFDEKMGLAIDRLYNYAFMKSDQDTSNTKYQQFVGKAASFWANAASASAFISSEILEIDKAVLDEYKKSSEAVRSFDRKLELIERDRAHTRSSEIEALLADSFECTAASSDIFKMFNNADTKFDPIENEKGELVEMSHGRYVTFMESSDRRVRKAAFESMYKPFINYKNTLAAAFSGNVKKSVFYAKAYKFNSSIEYHLSDANVPIKVYDSLIETVHKYMPLMYKYVALRKKVLGVDELHMYDVYTPIVPDVEIKVDYDEAKSIINKALAPMGKEYLDVLNEGFNNRWIDACENEGKRSGAYCTSVHGVHPYVLTTYKGNLDSVFTLIHEMGHAMHSWFSDKNQTYTNSQYKIFVAEVASTCNEALLNKYLLDTAEDKMQRAYIINHYLDGFKGTLFRQTMFAEFEKIAHEKCEAGEVLTAELLCDIYRELNKLYFGEDMIIDSEIDMEWARIPHFYSPFYVYQYATGFSAAIALSERISGGKAEALEDYLTFLKGGCTKDPIDLLVDAGVDMRTSAPVEAAMKVFEKLVTELEELLV